MRKKRLLYKKRRDVRPDSGCKRRECVDTTGAGDSFAAGFVYALSEGKSLKECAEFANACGAKAVQSVGLRSGW